MPTFPPVPDPSSLTSDVVMASKDQTITGAKVFKNGITADVISLSSSLYPPDEAGTVQTALGLITSAGVPSNANGSNGWYCINRANGDIFLKAAGVWSKVQPGNPMTSLDDIIIGGASGAQARLAKGADGAVLTVDPTSHHLSWNLNQASLATFGDGSDGALTFDGSTTILGMVPSGSAYTLTRDIFATTLTVNVGVSINTAGYRLLARTSLTNRGTIQNNGAAASGVNGGNSGSIGTIAGGLSGATGVVTAAVGAAGSNAGASLGGAGGGGGASGANAGGAGGAITTGNAYQLHALPLGLFGRMASGAVVFGGAGGGAGAGDGTHNPGGGGGGGGVVTLGAPTVDNSSTGLIQALGGVGANAVANSGGGGGGGGGVLVICYSVAYLIGTTSVAGGDGGTNGSGTGVAGAAGSAGTVITLN